MRVSFDDLTTLISDGFQRVGLTRAAALAVAQEVVFAEARGKKSHGLAMIESMLKRARKGGGPPEVVMRRDAGVLIDGRGAIGPHVAKLAMDQLCEITLERGMGAVGVRNESPFLTAGYSVWRGAVEAKIVTIAASVAKSKVAPFGGSKAILGTNPIAFAIPADPYPIVIDMAITKIPAAEVDQAIAAGERLPDGVAMDASGTLTTDPNEAKKGALIPFGDYKGSALGVIVELICGALLGAKCGLRHGEMRSMLFLAFRTDFFEDAASVAQAARDLREDIWSSNGAERVRCPGDRAQELFQRALTSGFDIEDAEVDRLRSLGRTERSAGQAST